MIVEFQAYLLLLLGVFCSTVLGQPRTVELRTAAGATRRGLQDLGWLALPALVLLIVRCDLRAFSLRYFVHPLAEWLL